MLPTITPLNNDTDFSMGMKYLLQNEIIAFPTDTVYGIGVLFHSYDGIQKLFSAKKRSTQKAIAVLIGDIDQLSMVAKIFPQAARKLAARFWPGALTLVLDKRDDLPENISPYPTIGVRMPGHPIVLDLLKITGPLATTSANLSGGRDPLSAQDVLEQLGDKIKYIYDGGRVFGGIPSTVVDCTTTPPAILRQGAITGTDISEVIK